ncbi:hypothetical protein FZEAL_5042 [Fusarium zealandicum]|uniref:Beta-lactamase-related domain-containing protein n=1 Tax=Fusarium zealandicum TaxID=1053134 RepID=A0A8H4UKL3_9HYPO|nr:hypothetical protein FZEAL_5042 [Fusarium zealandicum]
MIGLKTLSLSLLSVAFISLGQAIPTEECPILGPSFPSNFNPSNTKAIHDARAGFPQIIKSLFSSGALNSTHSSFAIDVFSTATNESIYSYYHAGNGLNDTLTAGHLDDETIFRIGSVSKIYTVYAILAHAGLDVFNHPVTDYVPELAGNSDNDPLARIRWEDVTVGALASQQAGSGGVPFASILCWMTPKACSVQDFLKAMKDNKRPVTPPFGPAIYSDGGFAVLGVVLERLTGKSYNDSLQSLLAAPLGLNSSISIKPKGQHLNALVLPGGPEMSSWGFDNQIAAPSGGVYSNAADLRTVGLSILNSQLLSPASTRKWMKPLSGTASLTYSVGAPWEINRLTLPVSPGSNRTRVSDLYTKLGGNAGYAAVFALSPDHGIGYSVLVAGPAAVVERAPLRDAAGTAFITAAEHAAAENAALNFAGTFVDESNQDSNLTLTVDKDHPGLGLKSWYVNGVDWRSNLTLPGIDPFPSDMITVRLYPIGAAIKNSSSGLQRLSFRAVAQIRPIGPRSDVEGGQGLFENGCQTWFDVGFWDSGDEFVFEIQNTRVESVENMVTRQVLKRVDERRDRETCDPGFGGGVGWIGFSISLLTIACLHLLSSLAPTFFWGARPHARPHLPSSAHSGRIFSLPAPYAQDACGGYSLPSSRPFTPSRVSAMAGLQPNIYAAVSITWCAAIIALILRLKARRMTKMRLWFDDYLAVTALSLTAIEDEAVADHVREKSRLLLWISELFYASSIAASKLAILSFYWRVFKYTSIRMALLVLLGTTSVWITVRTFLVIFHCIPVQAYWDKTIPNARCVLNEATFFFVTILIHCLMDCIILILPIIEVMKMHLPLSQKLAVVGLFTSGAIVCVASVFVLIQSINFNPRTREMPREMAANMMWAAVEINMAVFSACLPMLRPIFRKLIPGLTTEESTHGIGLPSVVASRSSDRKLRAQESRKTGLSRAPSHPLETEYGILADLISLRSHESTPRDDGLERGSGGR